MLAPTLALAIHASVLRLVPDFELQHQADAVEAAA